MLRRSENMSLLCQDIFKLFYLWHREAFEDDGRNSEELPYHVHDLLFRHRGDNTDLRRQFWKTEERL